MMHSNYKDGSHEYGMGIENKELGMETSLETWNGIQNESFSGKKGCRFNKVGM